MMLKRAALVVAVAGAFSCRTLPFPDPEYKGAYGAELKKWTQSATIYSGLDTRAFARVVYMSDEFVAAQAAELSRMRAEKPEQAAATLQRMRQEFHAPSLFAVVYVPDTRSNDWDAPDSVWRLALNLGLGETPPDRIERIDRPFNAELRVLYPYLDEYSVAYRIRFPDPVPQGEPRPAALANFQITDVEFVAAGALGQMRFHWNLKTGASGATSNEGAPEKPPESPKP